ncbi:glycosyltransferase family 2 protein [Natronosalvus vescus]|uniref:glycosyltransferase family 2 protein n=1 Tax=Natronosalvus vescus TaxID=2953881 RepID=UPI0021114A1F|nr:glycosyltransferase family 2 protein [Natronosalvus vescus]
MKVNSITEKSTDPIVSVVIPTYNRHQQTQRSVNSVTQQSYTNLELIVVDDGSDQPIEETLTVPEEVFTRYCVVRHEENLGANAARNTGVKLACGDYISFLDSDDEFQKDYIESVINAFEKSCSDCAGVYTSYEKVFHDGSKEVSEVIDGKTQLGDLKVRNEIGSFSCVTIKHDILTEVGLLDEELPSKQDYDFYLRVLKNGYYFHGLNEPKVNHYVHDDRISTNTKAKELGSAMLFEKHSDVLNQRWISNSLLNRGFINANQGNIHASRQLFWTSLKYDPKNIKAYVFLLLSIFGRQTFKIATYLSHKFRQRR